MTQPDHAGNNEQEKKLALMKAGAGRTKSQKQEANVAKMEAVVRQHCR
jgi:hypothetical protein